MISLSSHERVPVEPVGHKELRIGRQDIQDIQDTVRNGDHEERTEKRKKQKITIITSWLGESPIF
jgi:hypothetical protein